MKIRIMREVGINDLKEHKLDCESLANDLTEIVKLDILDKIKSLKDLATSSPDSVVQVITEYSSNKPHGEPDDTRRAELSALAIIHNRIMEKVGAGNMSFEELAYHSSLIKIIGDMMQEIENEQN